MFDNAGLVSNWEIFIKSIPIGSQGRADGVNEKGFLEGCIYKLWCCFTEDRKTKKRANVSHYTGLIICKQI